MLVKQVNLCCESHGWLIIVFHPKRTEWQMAVTTVEVYTGTILGTWLMTAQDVWWLITSSVNDSGNLPMVVDGSGLGISWCWGTSSYQGSSTMIASIMTIASMIVDKDESLLVLGGLPRNLGLGGNHNAASQKPGGSDLGERDYQPVTKNWLLQIIIKYSI